MSNGFNNAAGTTACSALQTTSACFNPYNFEASDPALLAALRNYSNVGRSRNEIFNVRAVVDGPLFSLPGGDVKVAVGAEYLRDDFSKGIMTGVDVNNLHLRNIVQTNESVFGEINVPVFGPDNATTLLHRLTFSAAGRYDAYFGGTFNPKLGVSYMPAPWLTLRGNWSKTFRAPTTVDQISMSRENSTVNSIPAAIFGGFLLDPSRPTPPNTAVGITLVT